MAQVGGLKYQVDQTHLQSLKKAQDGLEGLGTLASALLKLTMQETADESAKSAWATRNVSRFLRRALAAKIIVESVGGPIAVEHVRNVTDHKALNGISTEGGLD